ncbi:MAG: TolC family protein [Rubrivivax sp.]
MKSSMTMHTPARRSARLAIWSAVALLAGCAAVGPDYERPAVVLPDGFGHSGSSASFSGPEGSLPAEWWRLYGDAELTSLIDRALAANTTIAQAVARVELAQAQLREAGGAYLPSVNGNASAGRSSSSALSLGNQGRSFTGNSFGLSLSTSFEIDFWGRLRRTEEAARAQLLGTAAARDTVRLTVASAVAQNWFALRSLDAQIAATDQTLRSRVQGLRVFRQRLDAGVGSGLEVEQAEILRTDSAVLLRELQRQRAVTVSQLALLTGEPGLQLQASLVRPLMVGSAASAAASSASGVSAGEVGTSVANGAAATPPPPPLPPPGLPSTLLDRRPDIRAAEAQLAAANATIGVAQANRLPTVSLTGSLGQQSTELQSVLNAPARLWSLGIGLTAPIFDGGRLAARADQARARQQEALGAWRGTVQTAFKEVADALTAVSAARESALDLQRRDRSAQAALRLAQARFDAGYSGNLELLDAQRVATSAQLEAVRNLQQQYGASIDLIKALGGGWSGY